MSLDAPNLLLDSGILIHLCRGGEAEVRLQARYGLRDRRLVPWTSVVCVGEVMAMARRNGWGGPRVRVLQDLLAHLVVLNLRPGAIVDAYAELDAHLTRTGQRMGQQTTCGSLRPPGPPEPPSSPPTAASTCSTRSMCSASGWIL
ncbi:MAG TPA: hypothetical protein VHG28_05270 [Longimicrobiaceae bacterium]|nr:hypothetical protein [Longimicrobiaceae bacterium]